MFSDLLFDVADFICGVTENVAQKHSSDRLHTENL